MEEPRRKNDILLGELIGEFKGFRAQYEEARKTDNDERRLFREEIRFRLRKVEDFTDKLRSPYRVVMVILLGVCAGAAKTVWDFFKDNIHWG